MSEKGGKFCCTEFTQGQRTQLPNPDEPLLITCKLQRSCARLEHISGMALVSAFSAALMLSGGRGWMYWEYMHTSENRGFTPVWSGQKPFHQQQDLCLHWLLRQAHVNIMWTIHGQVHRVILTFSCLLLIRSMTALLPHTVFSCAICSKVYALSLQQIFPNWRVTL